jgi:hypothetical protein
MPSIEHQALVDLFRQNPDLAPRLLEQVFQIPIPPRCSVAIVEASLDQLTPIEFRADLVLTLSDGAAFKLAIILEVQLQMDPDKKLTWPVYVTVQRARSRCLACVLVVAPDEKVAAWAAEPIAVGPGDDRITPRVLGPALIPKVTDLRRGRAEPELAILSALAHGNGPDGPSVLDAALAGLFDFDPESAGVYAQLIYGALRAPMRKVMEELIMHHSTYGEITLPPFMQKFVDQGEAKGEAKGRAKGEAQAKREVLFKLIARAGLDLDSAERTRIEGCADVALLDRWIDNAFDAKSVAALFA